MKNILPALLIIIGLLASKSSYSQEKPLSNYYPYMLFSENPAYAASFEDIHLYTNGQSYLQGIAGSPENIGLGIALPFSLKQEGDDYQQALSLRMNMDKRGVFNTLYADLGYASHIKLSDAQDLFLGLSAGIMSKNLIRSRINMFEDVAPGFFDMGDPALSTDFYNQTRLLATAGFTYRFRNLEANFMLPSLFHYSSLQQNFTGGLSYNFAFKQKEEQGAFRIIPAAFYHYKSRLPDMYEFALKGVYQNTFWLASSYRSNQSLIFSAGVGLDEYLPTAPFMKSYELAYSYALGLGPLSHIAQSTHEIMLRINIDRKLLPDFNIFKGGAGSPKKSDDIKALQEENRRLKEENKRLTELINEKQLSDDIQDEYTANEDEVYNYYYVIVASFYNERDAKEYKQLLDEKTDIKTKLIARKDRKYFFIYTHRYNTQKEAVEEINRLNKTEIVNYIKGHIWIYGEK